jgi:hypothetical protein
MSKSGLFAVPRQYPRGEGLYNREKAIPKSQITRPLRRDAMRARVNTVISHAAFPPFLSGSPINAGIFARFRRRFSVGLGAIVMPQTRDSRTL